MSELMDNSFGSWLCCPARSALLPLLLPFLLPLLLPILSLQILNLVDNLVCALLHALAKLFEEERSAAWLDVREATNQVVLHLQDAEHHVLHVLLVVLLREVRCSHTFCQQFATQIVDVFFQVFAFHKPIIYIRYNSKVKGT